MQELRETVSKYSDKELMTQFINRKDDYTSEALAVMQEEIEKRGIDGSVLEKDGGEEKTNEGSATTVTFKSEDFLKFDHSFSRTDLLLASAILREHKVPFFVDNPTSSDTIPTESEAEKRFAINIPKQFADQTHALLDEHFVKADNKYLLKYTGARDRLRAFNFHDIHLTEKEAMEELETALSVEEKAVITTLGCRLLKEAEQVEMAQERVLFYFDSIGPLIERLDMPGMTSLSKNDLLTILEILQVYIDDPALPASMDEAISQVLALFIGP
ncbi:MAG: hypothetical protein JXA71_02515 [Chitinispirillaceae bacterium]|nr:hypothetical protein [Chitinispirillaceae bacterium]